MASPRPSTPWLNVIEVAVITASVVTLALVSVLMIPGFSFPESRLGVLFPSQVPQAETQSATATDVTEDRFSYLENKIASLEIDLAELSKRQARKLW